MDTPQLTKPYDDEADFQEGVVEKADPLELSIPDKDLIKVLDKRNKDSIDFYKKELNLYERRKTNFLYRFGRQLDDKISRKLLKKFEARFLDNVLYEIEESIIALALSQLPDMIVLPGEETDQQKETAELLTEVVDSDVKRRENREVLSLAFAHVPVDLVGIIKAVWNPEIDDYQFVHVDPQYVTIDHRAKTNDADEMDIITELRPITVQEVLMRFPKKKAAFLKQLEKDGVIIGENGLSWKQLATEIKIKEVWFTWYDKSDEEGKGIDGEKAQKWEVVKGLMVKYKDVVLEKMRNPNFDYSGEIRFYSYEDPSLDSTKQPVEAEEMLRSMMVGSPIPNLSEEQVYHNYFKFPRNPYFFMVDGPWGRHPFSETSRIEQNIKNQTTLDAQGKQIQETMQLRGKDVYSTDSGLEGSDIERIDTRNPDQAILVQGEINKTYQHIPPERPAPQEFENQSDLRNRMFSLAGANNLTGQLQTAVATSNQIAREANYTRIDSVVENTINAAAEWMADWAMQFIKLRYTEPHFRKILGDKGQVVFQRLHRDMIADGMEVRIKASGTDKIKAQQNALDAAKLGPPFTDPVSFFKDMGMSDPEGRAEMGTMYATDPQGYIAKFVLGLENTQQMVQAIDPTGGQAGTPPDAAIPTQDVAAPQLPGPENTASVPTAPPAGPPQGSPRGL